MQICEIWGCITLKDSTRLNCNGSTFEVHDSDGITSYPVSDFFDFIRGHEIISISDEFENETTLLCIGTGSPEGYAFNTVEQAVVGLKLLRLTQPPKIIGN